MNAAGVSKALSLRAGSARSTGTGLTVLGVRACLETAAYAFGNENLRFELGPAPGSLCKGKSPKFCSICADGCHLVVTGARIPDPFLVASSRKMLAEGGACAGVFLPVRLHLTPGSALGSGGLPESSHVSSRSSLCFVRVSTSY